MDGKRAFGNIYRFLFFRKGWETAAKSLTVLRRNTALYLDKQQYFKYNIVGRKLSAKCSKHINILKVSEI